MKDNKVTMVEKMNHIPGHLEMINISIKMTQMHRVNDERNVRKANLDVFKMSIKL